ncbi:anti-sigma factor [Arthrobacter cheniae]|uniref:Anti-sigma factor n=1 Tax=Arthrobacter cheniae TaxID=1258888 RepID=A0A3A5LYK0_9MICC|nr:anti-sigma factor [Arthrobacter cheniae]
MRHLDPESIGPAALDEPLDAWSRQHLENCPACTHDLEGLRNIVVIGKDGRSVSPLEQPGPAVWEAIKAELGLSVDLPSATPEPRVAVPGRVALPIPLKAKGADRPVRRFSVWGLAAAAVVGVAIGGGVLWGIVSLGGGGEGVTLAETELTPLPGYSGSGEAIVSLAEDGTRSLDVAITGTQPQGYREVWLIAPDLQEMYSIGLMEGDSGSFAVPTDIDLAQFPIVDISDEPFDGNPAHSSVSMIRGTVELPSS